MTLDVILYRFRSLWRIMVLGCLGPVAVVLTTAGVTGESYPMLLSLAFAVPIASVLRHTQLWHDTMAVSLVLSLCLALNFYLGTDLNFMEIGLRVAWMFALGITLFLMCVNTVYDLLNRGPIVVISPSATARSRFDIEALRRLVRS